MGKRTSKSFALLLVWIFFTSLIIFQPTTVKAQPTNQAPNLEFQKDYGNGRTESVSNLIQTSDGGYAFLDVGWMHGFTLQPATIYKVDSLGEIQWQKTIDFFIGNSVVQTSDGGYEISGDWNTYGTTYETTPTLIKTDSSGNIQWYENNTSVVPNFNVNGSRIQTSDGGFANILRNSSFEGIIKTDSSNHTQWTKWLLLHSDIGFNYSIALFSLIETSDGALAVLGVDNPHYGENVFGNVSFTKTQPFLPKPSPTQLPTPIPTPTTDNLILNLATPIIIATAILTIAIISALLFRKHQKTAKP